MKEDELYGDLDDAAVANPQTNTVTKKNDDATTIMSTSMSAQTMPTMMLQPEIMIQLQQQIKSLKAENDTLKRNIGILYRTAKSELERKDRTISQLQDEVDSLRRWEMKCLGIMWYKLLQRYYNEHVRMEKIKDIYLRMLVDTEQSNIKKIRVFT